MNHLLLSDGNLLQDLDLLLRRRLAAEDGGLPFRSRSLSSILPPEYIDHGIKAFHHLTSNPMECVRAHNTMPPYLILGEGDSFGRFLKTEESLGTLSFLHEIQVGRLMIGCIIMILAIEFSDEAIKGVTLLAIVLCHGLG
jgi:hypothetical protein